MSTFVTAGEARTYAAINGIDFDSQDDWCEACYAYHVGIDHPTAVPQTCGSVGIWGFNAINECARPRHEGDPHRDLAGTCWNDAPQT